MGFNKITIVDLEATCWEDKQYQQTMSEIIEIGCASLHLNTGIIDNVRSIYIIPFGLQNEIDGQRFKYPIISDYCTNLTGITKNKLMKQGKTFDEAIKELKKYYPTSAPWMSWGMYDCSMLDHECVVHNVTYPFKRGNHLNLKNLFGLVRKSKKGIGLRKALEVLGMEFEGSQHSGKDDAYNTGRIAKELFKI